MNSTPYEVRYKYLAVQPDGTYTEISAQQVAKMKKLNPATLMPTDHWTQRGSNSEVA
jgi:hypothetical protein